MRAILELQNALPTLLVTHSALGWVLSRFWADMSVDPDNGSRDLDPRSVDQFGS